MISERPEFSTLKSNPKTWLVTGVAGFIGSNLLEHLLRMNQTVVGLDNFSNGFHHNLESVKQQVGSDLFDKNFRLIEGDICDLDTCLNACENVDIVLHQAAVGSVPRSIEDPQRTHRNNVDGFVNMLDAARSCGVSKFVYASSSSVYGDTEVIPQIESELGNLLSPYAASKRTGELFAQTFSRCYDFSCIGLRYFNVFGPRQNPDGDYAAVIPKWISEVLSQKPSTINGDGSISRDFTFVENVVFANLLAALTPQKESVYNIALGGTTTLNELYEKISEAAELVTGKKYADVHHGPGRKGDIIFSSANIDRAVKELNFHEVVALNEGLRRTVQWYFEDQNPSE